MFHIFLEQKQVKTNQNNRETILSAVYFDQRTSTSHTICWSKLSFSVFSHLFPSQTEKRRIRARKMKNICEKVLLVLTNVQHLKSYQKSNLHWVILVLFYALFVQWSIFPLANIFKHLKSNCWLKHFVPLYLAHKFIDLCFPLSVSLPKDVSLRKESN